MGDLPRPAPPPPAPGRDRHTVERALDEAARGSLGPCLEALAGASEAARAPLTLAGWFADQVPRPPTVDELEATVAHATGGERAVAALAVPLLSRACLLSFDHRGLARLDELAGQLAHDGSLSPLERARVGLRRAVMERRAELVVASDLEERARAAGAADVVVEAAALGAMAETNGGAPAAALPLARRSVRMARTEGLRQEHYFAGLVLARVRRSLGQAHLASHILTTLQRVASRPWAPWIEWELALASGSAADGEHAPAPRLVELVRAYEAADAARVRHATSRLEACMPRGSWGFADWRCAAALLDPQVDCDDQELAAFRRGERDRIPHGMVQLIAAAPPVVFMITGARPERLGARGVALCVAPERRFERTQRQQRVFTLLAVVAGAAHDGIDEEEAFRRTYGFGYEREVHQDVFNVLIHRARTALDGRGELLREGGNLRLVTPAPLAIPDPRCEPPLDDRVLSLVSRKGAMAARAISTSLGVSLRSAQKALQGLVEEGACQRVKAGRAVIYAVEDTTFSEPTQRASPT